MELTHCGILFFCTQGDGTDALTRTPSLDYSDLTDTVTVRCQSAGSQVTHHCSSAAALTSLQQITRTLTLPLPLISQIQNLAHRWYREMH